MTKRLLVIDRDELGNFSLSVEAGTITLGASAKTPEAILRDLHIARIRCEIELTEDLVVIGKPETSLGSPAGSVLRLKELRPGESAQIGKARLHLEDGAAVAPAGAPVVTEASVLADFSDKVLTEVIKPPTVESPPRSEPAKSDPNLASVRKRLFVVDGADKGRFYMLPQSGMVTVGKSTKSVDIVLHDLYVSRVHCQLEIDGDRITVTHLHGDNGTLINGQRITQQSLGIGDTLRVGNEHLRLETALDGEESPEESEEEAIEFEVVKDDGDDTNEVELVEEETTEVEAAKPERAKPTGNDDPYSLPHPPIDQLRKLEGQTLGNYQIGPLLGRGQTSLIFRVLDAKNKQLVALKVMSPDFPNGDAELQRFVKALKVWAHLRHPHLVSLYGAGKIGGYCWLAREYVEGEGLARLVQRIKQGKHMDWKRACRVAIHVGKALEFLHKNRVSHGNVTPRNILIQKSDQATKLADLMLNQALEGSKLQKVILGKKLLAELPFMAPEQTDPHAPGTPLGDIYALGAVLYYLLTGEPPFTGTTPREVAARIREGKLVRPHEIQRGIPAPFEAAVLMMMARQPENRFQSASDLLAAVEPLADEHDIEV